MNLKLILIAFSLIAVPAQAKQPISTSLLPEVRKALEISEIDQSKMDQNAFVGLIAIDAPVGVEPQKVGKRILLKDFELYKKAIQKQDYWLMYKVGLLKDYYDDQEPITLHYHDYYSFACSYLVDHHCINKIMNEKDQVIQFILKNKLIFDRYKKYIKLSDYNVYTNNSYRPDTISILFWLSNLHLREAIYAIDNNDINQGLDILQTELNFSKKILNNPNVTAIDDIYSLQRIRLIYHITADLLDQPIMASQFQNPKLVALLAPFFKKDQQSLSVLMKNTRQRQIQEIYIYNKLDSLLSVKKQKEIEILNKQGVTVTGDIYQIMNLYYQQMKWYIKLGDIVLPDVANYLQQLQQTAQEKKLPLIQIYHKYGANNILGNSYIQYMKAHYATYFLNFYSTLNYRNLVAVKLKIKQANITKEQVPAFLKSLGNEAINPYNKKPFQWDSNQQTLSTEWLDPEMAYDTYGKRATILIPFTK